MSSAKSKTVAPEFSRLVDVDDLKDNETVREKITANDDERAALAERFGLIEISKLKADIRVTNKGGVVYLVEGSLVADIVQSCVVTVEPVPAHIEESFEVYCADAEAIPVVSNDMEYDISEDEDLPEPIIDGKIDIGELAAQYLSLAINPYPHAEGVNVEDDGTVWREHDENDKPERPNPFAVLKDLK